MKTQRKIDSKTVQHIAGLASLKLTEQEEELYMNQLSDILRYMETLNELDTDDVEPTYHAIEIKDVMRDDRPTDQSLPTEEGLRNAPLSGEGYFKVPKVIGSE